MSRLSFLFSILLLQFCWGDETFPQPIDVVYIWVDGSDPEWMAIKKAYANGWQIERNVSDATLDCRFTDHDELKYSLRSLWKNAPFFNHIYIVTMNQRPKWLQDHPMITIVDHKEIFRDLSHLPTFNSQAIESNLYLIPGLNEYFIYLNDDFFFSRPVSPYDFFSAEGKVKVLIEKWLSPSGPPNNTESSYRLAWRNTNKLLDTTYSEMPRQRLCHSPYAIRKSYMIASAIQFPEAFATTSSHRFRCSQDYNITNGLIQYHWYYYDWIELGDITNKMVDLKVKNDSDLDKTAYKFDEIRKYPPHTFCIEDNLHGKNPLTEKMVHDFLEELYPDPAPWEAH